MFQDSKAEWFTDLFQYKTIKLGQVSELESCDLSQVVKTCFLENAAFQNATQGNIKWFLKEKHGKAKASKNFDRLESGGNDATHVAQGLDLLKRVSTMPINSNEMYWKLLKCVSINNKLNQISKRRVVF